jgi:hypothetical protein
MPGGATLDHVSASPTLPRVDRAHRLAEILREPRGEARAALGTAGVDAIVEANRWSSSRTFQYAVPRAPTWPSSSTRARCFALMAVTAPVRMSVIVASTIATGTPVSGSIRLRMRAPTEAVLVVNDKSPTT